MMLIYLAALALQASAAPPPAPFLAQAPSPDAEAAVRAATDAFLDARDQGRFDAAYAMLSPDWQTRRPRPQWQAAAQDFVAHAGAVRGRRISGLSWMENPGGVQGMFAAVEYNGDYAGLAFMCGILVWQRQGDGRWLVFREQVHAASREDAPNATPEQIEEGRRQFGCHD